MMNPNRQQACVGLLALLLAGCSWLTVRPDPLRLPGPSVDGDDWNSGLLGYVTNEAGVVRLAVTPRLRARYHAMLSNYSARLAPAPAPDAGLTPYTNGTWLMNDEATRRFLDMNRWRLQERTP